MKRNYGYILFLIQNFNDLQLVQDVGNGNHCCHENLLYKGVIQPGCHEKLMPVTKKLHHKYFFTNTPMRGICINSFFSTFKIKITYAKIKRAPNDKLITKLP